MKQQVPVGAIVAAIVAILVVACFIGFRALAPDKGNPTAPKGMTDEQKAQYESQYKGGGPGPSGHSSSNMQGYPGSGAQGSSGAPGSGR